MRITFITVSATPNTIRPVSVSNSITGKALFGTDFTLSNNLAPGGTVTFLAGQNTVTITLAAIADHVAEKKDSLTFKLNKGAGHKLSKAKVTFVDSP